MQDFSDIIPASSEQIAQARPKNGRLAARVDALENSLEARKRYSTSSRLGELHTRSRSVSAKAPKKVEFARAREMGARARLMRMFIEV
jgi:hypothetical protein